MKKHVLLAALIAFSALSCSKNPDFKFKDVPHSSVSYSQSHAITEFVGSAADIIWVIDNSGSMDSYQQEVIQNTMQFISSFLRLAGANDWRMGLLSTDTSDSPYIGFTNADRLDHTTPNPVQTFQRAVAQLGTGGDSSEKSFDPITQAIQQYPDFVRPNAKLFLIFLSDELEQSRQSPQQFINFLTQLKGNIANVVTYGIFEMSENGCGSTQYMGDRYEQFITGTAGTAFDICRPDYGDMLAQIGADIGQRLTRPKIFLTQRPNLSTLKVLYKGVELPAGPVSSGGVWVYNYDENAIHFLDLSFATGNNENVQVVFDFEQ